MDDLTKVTLEAMVLLRQRIDQRIDAEVFRLTNGLYPVRETPGQLVEMIENSTYAEIMDADEIVGASE